MATITSDAAPRSESQAISFAELARQVVGVLGSLKLTVALFAASLIIVLVGTLAQDEMNMLEVKQQYFLCWVTLLNFDDFFPQAFLPHETPFRGAIPFPGGALIGVMLMINLVAAKATRFSVHASGGRLAAGIGFIVAGFVVAGLIIQTGHSSDGLQGNPPMEYHEFWSWVLAALAAMSVGSAIAAARTQRPAYRAVLASIAVGFAGFIWYSISQQWRVGDPGLRIVWQLTKGVGAGLVLLVGCRLLFDKQGGNVLLHLGVGLLMVGQFVFGDRQLEQQLSLVEGESTNTFVNTDAVELVLIEKGASADRVTAVPASRLLAAASSNELIKDDSLPVNIRVLEYFVNSDFDDIGETNLANTGTGLKTAVIDMPKSGGAESKINVASAYVELVDKESGESIGKHMVSQLLSDRKQLFNSSSGDMFDSVTVGETHYDLGLRFHREVKPYWVQLVDVKRTDYTGSSMVKDYSSFIRIVDTETGKESRERVWMNNPLRYRGETFYQSTYNSLSNGKEMTGIQVVRNSGWLIPYVACGITALGMLAHFLGTLTRFLNRRDRETKKKREELAQFKLDPPSQVPVYVSVFAFAAFGAVLLTPWTAVMNARRPDARAEKFDFYAAGKIPVQFGGRMMPLDSYARQSLKAMSNKESLSIKEAPGGFDKRSQGRSLSAIQWLMEVAVDEPQLRFMPMFRIDAEEVRSELGLERRKSKLFSLNEILPNWESVSKQLEVANEKAQVSAKSLTFKEKKLLQLDSRTRVYMRTVSSFQEPRMPVFPPKSFPGVDEETLKLFAFQELERRMKSFENMPAPSIIPPRQSDLDEALESGSMPKWSSFGPASFNDLAAEERAEDPDTFVARPGVETFRQMIQAYSDQDTVAFNTAVDDHLAAVNAQQVPRYSQGLVVLERWMQSNWPTGCATAMYLITLVMGLVYFAVDLPRLRRVVWGMLAVAIIVHTIAIVCRVMITQRAPVINLYSSAVFIGWAAVLFGIVVERIFRNGMGNMLSATSGVLTLLVAYGLNKGDTMPVLQAVLDTQFWLATHVISVTLGYVATLVAGTLGVGYLIASWAGKSKDTLRDLYRCCYGAACFGILFSFVGTVLGGLWADDSWGRFWGWDPKENGALLIVIWNALILHARWDGMVKARGFAILAICGNIVTAWSWFGTNELGIGLHSYGFTSGVLKWLSLFVFSQALFIVGGLLFRRDRDDLAS